VQDSSPSRLAREFHGGREARRLFCVRGADHICPAPADPALRLVEDNEGLLVFASGSSVWHRLADAPAFIEVAVGVLYIVVVAPAALAVVAWLLTRAETLAVALWARTVVLPSQSVRYQRGGREFER